MTNRNGGDTPSDPLASGDVDRRAPTVTVGIPARNAQATIDAQLAALAAQDYPHSWETVVVDNGSIDRTADIVAAWADRLPSLRLVSAPHAVGINHARNAIMAAAQADLVAICDADDVVDVGWLSAIVSAAKDADAVGGRLEFEVLNGHDVLAMRPEPPMHALPIVANFLPRPVGANFAVHKHIWAALGGFDEAYQRGGTETEFMWRLQLAGHSLVFAPDALVHYRFRPGGRAMFRQFYRFGRAQAQLYRDFRRVGMPRSSTTSFVRDSMWLFAHVGQLRGSATDRGHWIRLAATRWGRLVGTVRHRVVYL